MFNNCFRIALHVKPTNMNKLFFFLFIVFTLFSCENRRNPNLTPKKLKALIADDKNASSEQTTAKQLIMPEGYVPQTGVKYRQERDMSVPPVRIDIVKGIDNVRNITLSRIAKDITYINIGKHRFDVKLQITPRGLLVSSPDGVWLYAPDGQLIEEIYKNLCEYEPASIYGGVKLKTGDKFEGLEQVRYNEKDNRIWVKFRKDELKKQYSGFLGYIDMTLNVSNSELKQNPVIPLAEFDDGQMAFAENFVIHQPHHYHLQKNLLITNTFLGDTLCRFIFGYDSVRYRIFYKVMNVDNNIKYYYHGIYTFKPYHNDTLFRITAANVLKPEYILQTAQGKLSDDVKYEQLYILRSLQEDDRYLYLTFTINNFEGSNVWREWRGLYDKNTRDFFTLPVSEGRLYERGIENDIDGGLPFWPLEVGSQGEKYMYVRGENMKSLLTETWFARSKTLQPDKTTELKQFMLLVEDDDRVVIIVK